jgi:hypothetical protein
MNCQQFTSLIVEAARGQMSDAAARDGAMRHAEACAACAARLAQEQSLTGALRAVATGMKDLSAPPRIEAELLAAFREAADAQATKPNAAYAVSATPALVALHARDASALQTSSRPSPQTSRRTAFVATAIAASLALVALVTFYKQFAQTAPPRDVTAHHVAQDVTTGRIGQDVTTERVATRGGRESSNVAAANADLPPSPAPVRSVQQTEHDRLRKTTHDRPQTNVARAGSRRAEAARATTPRMIESRQVIDGGRAIFAPGEGESAANHAAGGAASSSRPNDEENVTEFLPLVADAPSATPLEGGQLVRVQVPRAALATLGLPLNAERGNEPVKADMLVGHDGLARAIRFVR